MNTDIVFYTFYLQSCRGGERWIEISLSLFLSPHLLPPCFIESEADTGTWVWGENACAAWTARISLC